MSVIQNCHFWPHRSKRGTRSFCPNILKAIEFLIHWSNSLKILSKSDCRYLRGVIIFTYHIHTNIVNKITFLRVFFPSNFEIFFFVKPKTFFFTLSVQCAQKSKNHFHKYLHTPKKFIKFVYGWAWWLVYILFVCE